MRTLKRIYLALILIFLYAPIAVLIVYSFNSERSRATWGGFSLKWYESLFRNEQIMEALYNTILIAILSAVIATIIGTAAALGINAMKKLSKSIVMSITKLPVLNPDIVTGISLMILFGFFINVFNWGQFGFMTMLMAHITFNVPYVILSVLPKIRQLDDNLFEAAQDLGATPFYAFTKVILPELWPGIMTGALLAFTLSLDDFIISFFTTGSGVNNLSILIYSSAKKSINPEINALSTIMFISVLLLLILINKRDKKELNL